MPKFLTDRANMVTAQARYEAARFNQNYIDPEHILLALVKEGSGVGANILKLLDVDLTAFKLDLESRMTTDPGNFTRDKLPQTATPRAETVIELAIQEAKNLNQLYAGTEHLLLALIKDEGVAGQVFTRFGLNYATLREKVTQITAATPHPPICSFGRGREYTL